MRKVCEMFAYKHTETIEYVKNQPTFLKKYKHYLTIENAKFSGYYFYINLKMQGDFQICISVPLMTKTY